MKNIFLFICGLLFFHLSVSAQNNIAVYVVCEDNIPQSYAKVVGTALSNAVNSDSYFVAVERTNEFLQASSSEVAYQNSGAVTQSQILELGKQFGANYVFTVDLSEVLGEMYASSRILNVASNTVEAVGEESAVISTLDQLKTFSKNIAQSTMAKLPHNEEKKKLENYRKLLSSYSEYIPETEIKFYNCWRFAEWRTSLEKAQEFVKARKALNLPAYNVVYGIEHTKDVPVEENYSCNRYLRIKYIDTDGNPQECTKYFYISPGSHFFRDSERGNAWIEPFLFYCRK